MSETPQTAIERIQRIVRDARESGEPISPMGSGVQNHIGYPAAENSRVVTTTALNEILEYTPDDLVVIAQAGVTLSALQAELAKHGQWLPIDVPDPDRQTLGGIVATRASSLVRSGYGAVRDWLIGIAVIGGDGQLIRGGGKVVKNVTGYDLPKLYCGSWGTLGIIVETAFKVAPLPQASMTLLALLPDQRNSEEAIERLLTATNPTFAYLFNAHAAKTLLGDDAEPAQYLAVRYDGPEESSDLLAGRAHEALMPLAVSVLDLPAAVAAPLGHAIRDFSAKDSEVTIRFNVLSSQTGAFCRMLEWTAAKAGFAAAVVAECASGILYAHFAPEGAAVDGNLSALYPLVLDKAERVGGSFVVERMPDAWRELDVPVWWPVTADVELMRGIKKAFDPGNVFNPGRFVGRI